jgi:hypothetical protein
LEITSRELMTLMHGMLFGGFFLMALFGAVALMLRSRHERAELSEDAIRWERRYLVGTVILGWLAVLSGAYIIYPWYRAAAPTGADLVGYPQRLLLSRPSTAGWHTLGMEWKEQVAWMAPMAMTMVAYVVSTYRGAWKSEPQMRRAVLGFAMAAFLAAVIAGGFGALIDKAAPVTGGKTLRLMQEAK